MAKSIDMDMLIKGTGSEEHQRELYKILALSGIHTDDLDNPEMLSIIKDVLTEYIVDEEMGEDDIDFTARSLAHKVSVG